MDNMIGYKLQINNTQMDFSRNEIIAEPFNYNSLQKTEVEK